MRPGISSGSSWHTLEPLPRSHISELDHASRAFNAMRNGLAWFETYVPRRLVRQLMDNPSPDAVASRQVEVTVLFTDIVGFSRLAERLDATPGGGAAQSSISSCWPAASPRPTAPSTSSWATG